MVPKKLYLCQMHLHTLHDVESTSQVAIHTFL